MYSYEEILKADPEIAQAITDEMKRQNSHIELIASENWVSKAVMAAMGSPLTNKYAEGYPSKRYYGGLSMCGRSRKPGQRPGKRIIWMRLCQCAAAFRGAGKSCGLFCNA